MGLLSRALREERQLNVSVCGVEVLAHQHAAVRLRSAPDSRPRMPQMRSLCLEELDLLRPVDRVGLGRLRYACALCL